MQKQLLVDNHFSCLTAKTCGENADHMEFWENLSRNDERQLLESSETTLSSYERNLRSKPALINFNSFDRPNKIFLTVSEDFMGDLVNSNPSYHYQFKADRNNFHLEYINVSGCSKEFSSC